jgi:hypothetical protein
MILLNQSIYFFIKSYKPYSLVLLNKIHLSELTGMKVKWWIYVIHNWFKMSDTKTGSFILFNKYAIISKTTLSVFQ